jgi:hypothetical protein
MMGVDSCCFMLLLNPSESSMSFLQKRSSPGPVTGFAVFVAGSWQVHGRFMAGQKKQLPQKQIRSDEQFICANVSISATWMQQK